MWRRLVGLGLGLGFGFGLGCGGGQRTTPPVATEPAAVAATNPHVEPSSTQSDPSVHRFATVLSADQLSWMDRKGGKIAVLWQQDNDTSGGLISMAAPSAIRASTDKSDRMYVGLGASPQVRLFAASDPGPMLECAGTAACTYYSHPVPRGQRIATSRAWTGYGPDRRLSPLWGNLESGPFGVLVEVKAGTAPFWHMHGRDVRMVVLAGTVEFRESGHPVQALAPGSYVQQSGGYKHTEGCAAGADCVLYVHGERGFDVKPL